MKVGLSIKLDVTKIDKERLFQGAKGTYLDLTTFIDTAEQDQYENNGFVSQSTSAEEREQGVKTPILGNVKVFFTDGAAPAKSKAAPDAIDEDIPF
tara:strand:- start:2488 stop:2775 length:288 start_codon:yes stop_codon:yes gene_type:complete